MSQTPRRRRGRNKCALEWSPAPRPYDVAFASSTASSSVANLPTARTGPKICSTVMNGISRALGAAPVCERTSSWTCHPRTDVSQQHEGRERDRRQPRDEVAHDFHVRPNVGEDGWVDEVAFPRALLAAGDDLRAFLLARLDIAPDPVVLAWRKNSSARSCLARTPTQTCLRLRHLFNGEFDKNNRRESEYDEEGRSDIPPVHRRSCRRSRRRSRAAGPFPLESGETCHRRILARKRASPRCSPGRCYRGYRERSSSRLQGSENKATRPTKTKKRTTA